MKRRVPFLTRLADRAQMVEGITRLRNYFLQPDPKEGDGLPFLIVPYSDKLKSLFAFTSVCEKMGCEACWGRTTCLRRVAIRLEKAGKRVMHKQVTIDDLLLENEEDLMTVTTGKAFGDNNREALKLLREIVMDLAIKD